MNKKNVLQLFSLILCAAFFIAMPVAVNANESGNEEPVYFDNEQGRIVNDVEDYLEQLNNGVITPFDATITTYEPNITPFDVSDPSESCSNIFGHKWGNWGGWEEVSRVHFPKSPCSAEMERWQFCERTHCSAYRIETDRVWVTCYH